jgi:preprotein translocase subunit YajC
MWQLTNNPSAKITIKIIKENKDGSANAQVDFDKEGLEVLVQWGMVAILTKAIDEYAIRPDQDSTSIIARARAVAKEKSVEKKEKNK